jgi:hypothetical protein
MVQDTEGKGCRLLFWLPFGSPQHALQTPNSNKEWNTKEKSSFFSHSSPIIIRAGLLLWVLGFWKETDDVSCAFSVKASESGTRPKQTDRAGRSDNETPEFCQHYGPQNKL